jgi:hypothetical protein
MELDQLIADTNFGMKHRNRLYKRIIRHYPEYVKTHKTNYPGKKHEMTLHKNKYPVLVEIVNGQRRVNRPDGEGYIYCFFAAESFRTTFLKVGRTEDVTKRMSSYVGPMRPTEMVGTLYVRNQQKAEDILVKHFGNSFEPDSREWFKIPDVLRHKVCRVWVKACLEVCDVEGTGPENVSCDAMSTDSPAEL